MKNDLASTFATVVLDLSLGTAAPYEVRKRPDLRSCGKIASRGIVAQRGAMNAPDTCPKALVREANFAGRQILVPS